MTAIIDNLTDKMLFISLTDGRTLDLSPQVCPVSIPENELKVNVKIKKLLARGVIRLVSKETKNKTEANTRAGDASNPEKKYDPVDVDVDVDVDEAGVGPKAELSLKKKLQTEKNKRVKKKSAPSTKTNK